MRLEAEPNDEPGRWRWVPVSARTVAMVCSSVYSPLHPILLERPRRDHKLTGDRVDFIQPRHSRLLVVRRAVLPVAMQQSTLKLHHELRTCAGTSHSAQATELLCPIPRPRRRSQTGRSPIQPIIQAVSHQHMLRVFRRPAPRDLERPRQTHALHREFIDICSQVRRSTWFCGSVVLSCVATGVTRFLVLSAARQQDDGQRLPRAQESVRA